jgi:HD-GYP domain-containing protein (c-di-GMP phosphodiesterase class II)
MLSATLLVILLTSGFLYTVFRTFNVNSEENATARFSLIAGRAADELSGLLRNSGKFVTAQARADLALFVEDGRLNPTDVVAGFLASLEADPTLYSHFFGLANEEFLQVIGIRGDARIAAALSAPAGAWFAVRRIRLGAGGARFDRSDFLDQDRRLLGSREQAATLRPSSRPWYGSTLQRGALAVTSPYLFDSTRELGITVAMPLARQAGVLATDISLRSLQAVLAGLALPPNGAIALQDGQGRVLAFHGRGNRFQTTNIAPMTPPERIGNSYLAVLRSPAHHGGSAILSLGEGAGEKFVVTRQQTETVGGARFGIVVLAPLSDFTGAFWQAQRDVVLLAGAVLLMLLPLAFFGSRRVSATLEAMADDSERLKRLDFSREPHRPRTFLYEIKALGEAQLVLHKAIRKRTRDLEKSQEKLARLVDNGIRLSREQNRTDLLRHILFGAREIAHCAAATIYLKTERNTLEFALRTNDISLPVSELPLFAADGGPNESYVVVYSALRHETVLIDDVYRETRFDLSGTKRFSEQSGFRTVSMLTVPLSPREGEVIGVIQLLNALDPATDAVVPFPPDLVGFVEALASQSAVALENQNLLEAQRQLMDALIELIAGAIDAKSPYTGGHCERVPELAMMLAEAACRADTGPLANFCFGNEDEWREFRIGAWLHDCGKVTTPEYVVDKATKLETIYNRIHEVRTRFEVLLRDVRIEQLEAVAAGVDPARALAAYEARKARLVDDFAFVAECNEGGEVMAPERIERLKRIAEQTWQRHFDDRLGLSHGEHDRCRTEPSPLPATEKLLADRPEHIIPRTRIDLADPKWGFKVEVPEHQYNQGEIHNLSVGRGTLTDEERFKINEHVMQSLIMLEQLPLPKNLRRVPLYAGTHHETLTGTGYPRKLGEAELDIPMRIMAIADIFEALTASDRPYKKPKTLSESVGILSFFKKDRHIDPDLFDLFLTSGVYLRYAERYLRPEQIDEVDVGRFVG